MSAMAISYRSLRNASSEADDVAKKLNTYANSLNSRVYEKLNKYDGEWTSNISTARSKVECKISDLRDTARKYEQFASDLSDLKEDCERVDKNVRQRISSLTTSFKENNGIRNSVIENSINYLLTSIDNLNAVGRWLGDKKDQLNNAKDYLKKRIKEIWDYEGGKQFVMGSIAACASIGLALATLLNPITGVLGVLTAVGAAIGLVAGIVNAGSELTGFYYTHCLNDPATGRRASNINSLPDLLKLSDNKTLHNIANGIEVVDFVCGIASFVSGFGKLLKNGYKWATGSLDDLKNIKYTTVFSKDAIKAFGSKCLDTVNAIKTDGLKLLKNFGTDLLENLKKNFSNPLKKADGAKFTLKLAKNFGNDKLNIKTIVKDFILPASSIGKISTRINSTDSKEDLVKGNIFISDFVDIYDKFKSILTNSGKIIEEGIDVIKTPDFSVNIDTINSMTNNITIDNLDINMVDIRTEMKDSSLNFNLNNNLNIKDISSNINMETIENISLGAMNWNIEKKLIHKLEIPNVDKISIRRVDINDRIFHIIPGVPAPSAENLILRPIFIQM